MNVTAQTLPICFREAAEIVSKIDEWARIRGTDRSAIIREAIRNELHRLSRMATE